MANPVRHAIILEVGRGVRRLNVRQSKPRALQPLVPGRETVMDQVLDTLRLCGIACVTYIGSYHIEKMVERYPDLRLRYLAPDAGQGELAALRLVDSQDADVLILRAGTILLPEAVERLAAGPAWGMYRRGGIAAFAGVLHLPGGTAKEAFAAAARIVAERQKGALEDLPAALGRSSGLIEVDLTGTAAPITDRQAVVATIFRGKARTLEYLAPLVRDAVILDQIRFTVGGWRAAAAAELDRIILTFPDGALVVRSSSLAEDSLMQSSAGRFLSVLDVPAGDRDRIRDAVERVIGSYADALGTIDDQHEVLVQRQVRDLVASGVLLTRDPHTGAPYFVLNVHRDSARSDVVTSGGEGRIDTYYVLRDAPENAGHPPYLARLLAAARRITEITCLDSLDLEFGITVDGRCVLFQVRPLTVVNRMTLEDEDFLDLVGRSAEFVATRMAPHPLLAGRTSLLGNMPDWNPAEMLGLNPRPLALSLYQALIGRSAWAAARMRLGYRDVRPVSLIVSVAGRPFVDVRASLNSFLPADLPDAIAGPWVDYGIERLRADPALHDKIEFEVAATCLAPDWPAHAARMAEAGLDRRQIAEFRGRLRILTEAILTGQREPIDRQVAAIGLLEERRARILASVRDDVNGLAEAVHLLLEDCRRLGLVPFSILARYAFIAMAQLRGLRGAGVLSESTYEAFLLSVDTVAGALSRDLAAFRSGRLPQTEILARYGHLRPNSYEITVPNYAAMPEFYLCGAPLPAAGRPEGTPLDILSPYATGIVRTMEELGLPGDVVLLAGFIARSISGREWAKFEFMKSVDAILDLMGRLGGRLGLTREEVSMLPLEELLPFERSSVTGATADVLRRQWNFHAKRWTMTCALHLPDLIRSPDELGSFRQREGRPNFITRRRVVAPAVWLDEGGPAPDLAGAIAVIRAADPGHDWIFGHGVAGLVTQYGGVASHMAIRAAEFGLPAAIGCGDALVEALRGARLVELDCGQERVRPAS